MAGGYDGSIRFDTSISPKGFNAGIKRISESIKGVMNSVSKGFGNVQGFIGKVGATTSGAMSQVLAVIGKVVAAVGTVAAVALGVVAAIVLIITAIVGAGVAIFAWAQKFTNTLYKSLAVTSGYRAEVMQLKGAFDTLKGAVTGLGIQLLSAIAPAIMAVINWLVKAINWVSMFIAALRGQSTYMKYVSGTAEGAANSTGKAAKNTDKLAKSTKNAAKEAKGALAAFDAINVLQQETADNADIQDVADAPSGGSGSGGNMMFEPTAIEPQILETVKKIKDWFSGAWAWVKQAGIDAWTWIGQAANDVWIWIRRVWTQAGTFFLGVWAGISKVATDVWNWILSIWTPIATWFQENVTGPIRAKLVEFFAELKILGTIIYNSLIQPVVGWLVDTLWPIIQTVFGWIGQFLGAELVVLGGIWKTFADWMVNLFSVSWDWLKNVFQSVWNLIVSIFKNVWVMFSGIVSGIILTFTGIIEFLTGVFTGNWSKAWEGIKDIFKGVWDMVFSISKGVINSIIDLINAMIRGIITGVNAAISALNSIQVKVPSWVPKIGGNSWGVNLSSVNAPQIPRLATGAVIPPNSQFLAVLGDQRHGTNIEAPADLIRQIVREETQNMGSQGVTVNFTGTMAQLIQAMNPEIQRENRRVGPSLVAGVS